MSANRNVSGPLDLPSSAMKKSNFFLRNMATGNAGKPLKVSGKLEKQLFWEVISVCVSKVFLFFHENVPAFRFLRFYEQNTTKP